MRKRLPRSALPIGALIVCYAALESFYALRLPLVMDEFHGASVIQELVERVPYRDTRPYKTVLGYFLQLPPLLVFPEAWAGLIATKLWMVLINGLALVWFSRTLARRYRVDAVLLALPLLLIMSSFLERSAELRVDMLTAWAGVASLMLLLAGRYGLAGIVAGLSFLVSQKGAMYVAAGALACLIPLTWLQFRRATVFCLSAAAAILAYVAVWTVPSSLESVIQPTFLSAATVAATPVPMPRLEFWAQTLTFNPVFWCLGLLGLWSAYRSTPTGGGAAPRERALAAYGVVVFGLGVAYRHPWPYHFLLLIPTVFVLLVSWLDKVRRSHPTTNWLPLPAPLAGAYLVGGILLPCVSLYTTLSRDNTLQRLNVEFAHATLRPGEGYLAGMRLFRDRPHQPISLGWLDNARRVALQARPSAALAALADTIAADPPKLLFDNYRVRDLPCPLLRALDANYRRTYGNIWLYAPLIEPGAARRIAYTARYSVEATPGAHLMLGGTVYQAGDTVSADRGSVVSAQSGSVRLRLIPPVPVPVTDPGPRELFYEHNRYHLPFAAPAVPSPDSFGSRCGRAE